jgi:outer membrane lipoprotein SlyB
MPLSNSIIAGGVAGALGGAAVGIAVGRNIGASTPNDNPWPELLGVLGALTGGVLLAAIGNNLDQSITMTRTSSNTQNANALPNLPPPGA